jgi:hypothetical protein
MKVGLALTWDGARWPVSRLPDKAQKFLASSTKAPATTQLSRLLVDDRVRELRICWVPRIKGGNTTLAMPFVIPGGKRLGFEETRRVQLGDCCGLIYRRRRR